MKKTISVPAHKPLLTLMEGLTYWNVPDWYAVTARPLQLDILLPRDRKGLTPRPLLVWLCGGAFQKTSRSVWLPEMVAYARNGYIVACVDYRVVSSAPYPAAVIDVKAAIRFLRAHAKDYVIDPSRVAVMGESAGGYLACMAALGGTEYDVGDWLEQPSGVQAVVNYYGKLDMDAQSENNREMVAVVEDFMAECPNAAQSASPFNLVTPDAPPFLIFHGTDDPLVPIAESNRLYQALSDAKVRADYYVLQGAAHGTAEFYQPEIQQVIMQFLHETMR